MADFKYDPFSYVDYTKSAEVLEAEKRKANAENAVANYGDFNFSKQADWDSIYRDYKNWNQNGFTYDVNADALYQQYKDKYIQQGRMAMADTIGQASAMTGGYGNSYAATVGNQAYQAHLDKLNDVIPELYQLAYDRHNQKGQSMLNMLGLLGSERDFEYGTWGDGYNKLVADRGYYSGEASDAYNRDYGTWSDNRTFEYGKWNDGRNFAYGQHRDGIADEQWAKNYAISDAELKMAQEKWDMEKAASAQALSNPTTTPTTTPTATPTKTKDEPPEGMDKPTYDSIKSELNTYIKNGAKKSEINNYLREAYKSGYITQSQYNELKSRFAPRGYTY